MKKLIFQSTVCLQRFWRKKIRQRREKAANLLITFLKAQKARQAFYTAAWAASVLKMFAVQVFYFISKVISCFQVIFMVNWMDKMMFLETLLRLFCFTSFIMFLFL